MADKATEPKGFFAEVGDSVRSHIEERARSPFAGAFVLAWLTVNWPVVVYFFESDRPIVERISVAGSLLDQWHALWYPVLVAFALALVFYACSTLFIVLAESYGVVRRFSQRKFDKLTWVAPNEFIRLKQEFEEENGRLTSLASGNLALVDAEKTKAVEAARKALELQEELADRSGKLEAAISELGVVKEELAAQNGLRNEMLARMEVNSANRKLLIDASTGALTLGNRLRMRLDRVADGRLDQEEITRLLSHLERIRSALGNFTADDSETVSSDRLTVDSVSKMLRRLYPGLPVDSSQLRRILLDVEASGLGARIRAVGDVERVLAATGFALEMYRADRPALFTKASDFLSKGLGFAFPEFARTHRFSKETQNAISKYSDLVEPVDLP